MVAVALAKHVNRHTGRCDPSTALLMTECRMSNKGVINAIKRLVELGILEIEAGGGRGNTNLYNFANFTKYKPKTVNSVHRKEEINCELSSVNSEGSSRFKPETVNSVPETVNSVHTNRNEPEDIITVNKQEDAQASAASHTETTSTGGKNGHTEKTFPKKEKKKKASKTKWAKPSEEEFVSYAVAEGYPADASRNQYAIWIKGKNGWNIVSGRKIQNWQQTLTNFAKNQWGAFAQNGHTPSKKTSQEHDDEFNQWMNSKAKQ
jgi:hypothetical protein